MGGLNFQSDLDFQTQISKKLNILDNAMSSRAPENLQFFKIVHKTVDKVPCIKKQFAKSVFGSIKCASEFVQ